MKKYLYGSQIVEAALILAVSKEIGCYDKKHGLQLDAPDAPVRVEPEWMEQNKPKPGDYLIRGERDGRPDTLYAISSEALAANYTPLDAVKLATLGQPMKDYTAPTEAELAERLTAPRITPGDIDAAIKAVDFYVFPGSMLTVCCLTLQNGYTVTGESACAAPENFKKDIGERYAVESAKRKVWPLLGFMLKQRLFERGTPGPAYN